jgi:hypothetical protein
LAAAGTPPEKAYDCFRDCTSRNPAHLLDDHAERAAVQIGSELSRPDYAGGKRARFKSGGPTRIRAAPVQDVIQVETTTWVTRRLKELSAERATVAGRLGDNGFLKGPGPLHPRLGCLPVHGEGIGEASAARLRRRDPAPRGSYGARPGLVLSDYGFGGACVASQFLSPCPIVAYSA